MLSTAEHPNSIVYAVVRDYINGDITGAVCKRGRGIMRSQEGRE